MVKLDIRDAEKELEKLKQQLSNKQIADAARMALNEGARRGKTEVKKSITSVYAIKASLITDSNKKRGLSIKPATNKNLTAEIDAGHIPITLANANPKFKGTIVATQLKIKNGEAQKGQSFKRSISTISIEIIKGQRKEIPSAFTVGVANNAGTSAIFARGKRGKPTFQFSKPRLPIDSMSTISIATASLNTEAQGQYTPIVEDYVAKRFEHHIARQLNRS